MSQSDKKKFVILSRMEAREFTSDKPWAAISISSDCDGGWPDLNKYQLVAALQLNFIDCDNRQWYEDAQNGYKAALEIFDEDLANRILDFVSKIWDKIDVLMVHCYAGMSRSPAVAAAISKILYDDNKEFFANYMPNMHVYRTIINAAFKRGLISASDTTSPEELAAYKKRKDEFVANLDHGVKPLA